MAHRSTPAPRRRTLLWGLCLLALISSIVGVRASAVPPTPDDEQPKTAFAWETDLERAVELAKSTDRPLLLVFR